MGTSPVHCMTNSDVIPTTDEVLADKYRIERVLGRGGMGIVLAAMHVQLEERVAIKFLLPELAHDQALVGRFLREARAAIKIRSEHVVRVLDIGALAGGTPYMVMEHLQGRNFEELLEDQGCLPSEIAVDHVLQATEALAEAHAQGMIHRDLKPANLFLAHRADGSPCVKVLDFGITKLMDPSGEPPALDSTNASVVMGSPRYMSPEQMRSTKTLDARADIWALGVILHELIAGASPFDGATMPDLLAAILQDPTPLLRKTRPDVPAGLEVVVARCLEKEPEGRYADVAELTQALAPFGTASARVSADRVSRVIRPRSPADSRTSAPIVRNAIPAELLGEAPSGTVTVSATSGWDGAAMRPRTRARQIGFVVGGIAFVSTMFFAIFGNHGTQSAAAASTRASAEPGTVPASGSPFTSEPTYPAIALTTTPTATTTPPQPQASNPDEAAKLRSLPVPPASARASRRDPPQPPPAPAPGRVPAPATATAHPSTTPTVEPDLFDGRK
jgi:serine/threonine protein kinase